MRITQIKQVLEVARVGSISQAATNLYITQPNLSQSIRKLEEEIGAQIFQRTNTGVALTSFGTRFVANASEVIMQMDLLDDMCSIQAKARPMELAVASGGYLFVTRQLAALIRKYAGNPIEMRYFEADGQRQIELIRNNQAEIGFTSLWSYERRTLLKRFYSAGLDYHSLVKATPGIYVDRNNPYFSDEDKVVDLSKLRRLPYVTTRKTEENTNAFIRAIFPGEDLLELTCATRVVYLENSGTMRDFLSVTDGFALASYCNTIYDKSGFYDHMRFIPFPPGVLDVEVGWLQRSNSVRSVLADELIAALQINLI